MRAIAHPKIAKHGENGQKDQFQFSIVKIVTGTQTANTLAKNGQKWTNMGKLPKIEKMKKWSKNNH